MSQKPDIDDGGPVLSWLSDALRSAERRKRNAARRNDFVSADEAQTDEEAVRHVIAMLARNER